MKCPWTECEYVRQSTDTNPKWECPACHNIYYKHPDYYGNNYYEIQLIYHAFPSDNQILSGILYLYLNNEKLEGAFINNHGKVQRIIFTRENLPHLLEFEAIVNIPNAHLNNEQERIIFIATAKILTGQEENRDVHHQHNPLSSYIVSILILIITISIIYIGFHNYEPKRIAIESTERTKHNEKTPKNINVLLTEKGINLGELQSKMITIESLIAQCKNECFPPNPSNSCNKLNELLENTTPKISQYRQFMQQNSIDGLSAQDKEIIYKINDQISSLPREFDLINSTCGQKRNLLVSGTIDLQSMGINLDLLYSKVYSADAIIRNCRMSCEVHKTSNADCQMFINLEKEFGPDVQKLNGIIEKNKDKLSAQDGSQIRNISSIVDDIISERQKVVDCMQGGGR